jgi:hypothetical protein
MRFLSCLRDSDINAISTYLRAGRTGGGERDDD